MIHSTALSSHSVTFHSLRKDAFCHSNVSRKCHEIKAASVQCIHDSKRIHNSIFVSSSKCIFFFKERYSSVEKIPISSSLDVRFPSLTRSLSSCKYKRSFLLKSIKDDNASTVTDVLPSSNNQEIVSFISQGPLLNKVGIKSNQILEGIDEWIKFSALLCEQLNFDADNLNESQKRRIYHYYIPVFLWCRNQLQSFRNSFDTKNKPIPAFVIGISAPQGCGKTTVVESLEFLFKKCEIPAASVSIDDFYLTFKEQSELASQNPGNKLLELRGNAGSHDLSLGSQTLQSLKNWNEKEKTVKLARYDKSANSGRGDRFGVSDWVPISEPVQVVLFEGWMLGFEPIAENEIRAIDPQLVTVNQKLSDYATWHDLVDAWIVIQVDDPNWVFKWRLQAEVQMRANGKPGMTDEQVADFVSRYMPAYRAYLPGLYKNGPKSSDPQSSLFLHIDENRNPVA